MQQAYLSFFNKSDLKFNLNPILGLIVNNWPFIFLFFVLHQLLKKISDSQLITGLLFSPASY